MPDLTRRQTRILFELSNGKRLIVSEAASQAFICDRAELDDPRRGVATRYDDFRRLSETECLAREGRALVGIGEVTAYSLSPAGIETLLETSMRPYEE
jgi:hypothetical protein